MLNKARVWFGQVEPWRLVAYLALVLLIFFLFFWDLSSFTAGLSPGEVAARSGSKGLHAIYNNPVNAPFKFLQYIFLKISPESIASLKLPSAIMACVFGFCFYKLASAWFGKLIGGFGTLIFLSLPLFVISARQATAEIMFFSFIVLLWLYAWFSKTTKSKIWVGLLLVTSSALLLYTPGTVWLLMGGLVLCRKQLRVAFSEFNSRMKIGYILIFLIIIAPLLISSVSHTDALKSLFLIPVNPDSVTAIIKNTAWGVAAIFIKSPQSQLVIGYLPILNLVALALVIFGVYAMQAAARKKAIWLGLMLLLGILAAGLNGNIVYVALGLPALGLFISAGLRYLYIEWRAIFPRNPVPKTFALILIAAVVASQVYYGVRYSLIAWPHSVTTKSVYVLK